MSTFDVRTDKEAIINEIQCSDTVIIRQAGIKTIKIVDKYIEDDVIYITGKREVTDLITGLQKTIELGWVE